VSETTSPTPSPGGTTPETARGRATEQAILAAALACFSERGFHGASIRFISQRAGTSLANVYNYVASKDEMLVLLLRRASEEQYAEVAAAIAASTEDPRSRLQAATASYARYAVEHRAEQVLSNTEFRYLSDDFRAEVVQYRDRTQRLFTDLIEEGVRAGTFHTAYPQDAARSLLTMVSHIVAWFRTEGPLSPNEVARRHGTFALALVESD